MINVDEIIQGCLTDKIDKVYPYFIYIQDNERFPVFHFFDNQIIFIPNISRYYGKAWCKRSFEFPYRQCLVPLTGDRVRSTDGSVIEIIHIITQ